MWVFGILFGSDSSASKTDLRYCLSSDGTDGEFKIAPILHRVTWDDSEAFFNLSESDIRTPSCIVCHYKS